MFTPNSRYWKLPTYSVRMAGGRSVQATELPVPASGPILGFHRRLEGERLDLIAARYLQDPTWFWMLCDAANAMVPSSLPARDLMPIPRQST
jgi:hypothetical protein